MAFTRPERLAIIRLGVVAGFIVGLDHLVIFKGDVISIDYTSGLGFVILMMLGMVASVAVHESAHKWLAKSIGYYTHIRNYPPGLVVGSALSLFTFGWVQFFTPNTIDVEANVQARIAKHRKYENWKQEAFIALGGIFATAVFAVVLHGAYSATNWELFRKLMLGNIWLMVYSLIPFELVTIYSLRFMQRIDNLPQSDGLYLLHYSILMWVFVAVFVLMLSLLLWLFNTPALSIALLIALTATFVTWFNTFKQS